jgi:tetratricopeptide (TPR) repeat protein/signal transduction histidine kinase
MMLHPTICAFLITVACAFSFLRTCGQDKLDSLLRADREQVNENKDRVSLWVEIAKEYQYTNTTAGLVYADKAIVAAKRLDAADELGAALDVRGQLYYRSGQHKEAVASLDTALEILKKTGNRRGMSKVYADVGMVYWQTSEWKKAIEYFNQSIALAEEGKDEQTAGDSYGEIGIIYYEQTNFSRALDYFQKALDIHLKYNNVRSAAQNLQDMGMIYSDRSEYSKAMDYLLRAARMNERINNLSGLAHNDANLGWLYEEIEDYSHASEYYQKSLAISRQTGERFGVYYNLQVLGSLKLRMKDYAGAMADLRQALPLADSLGNKHGIAMVRNFLGNTYAAIGNADEAMTEYEKAGVLFGSIDNKRDIGDNMEKRAEVILDAPDKALLDHHIAPGHRLDTVRSLLDHAMILAGEASDKNIRANILKTSASLYERRGEIGRAFSDFRRYIALRDSLTDKNRQKELEQKGIQYEFDRKADSLHFENQLAEAKLQENLRQERLYGVAIFLLLCAMTGFLLYRNKIRQATLNAELERKMSDAKLSSLLSQMNPHFIFNCLGSIKQMILENEQENANNYLNKFSRMIRLSLEYSKRPYVTVSEKLDYLNNYLQMELLRFDHSFTYHIEVDEDICVEEVGVPPMMLQPLVENAIWHGLMNKPGNRELFIRYKLRKDRLICEIEDNGIGISRASQLPRHGHRSFGIENIRHRLNLLNEKYHLDCQLEIKDKSEMDENRSGTLAILTLPLLNDPGAYDQNRFSR